MKPLTPSQKHIANRALLTEVARLSVLAAFTLFAFPAHAYLGQALLDWAKVYILAPLGLFAVVVALAASVWRPDLVKSAIYAAIICAVLFFVISAAGTLMTTMQS